MPENRARFVVGTLERSGLDGGSLDAALCLDTIFSADRVAALRDTPTLASGRRFGFTADSVPSSSDRRKSLAGPRWSLGLYRPAALGRPLIGGVIGVFVAQQAPDGTRCSLTGRRVGAVVLRQQVPLVRGPL